MCSGAPKFGGHGAGDLWHSDPESPFQWATAAQGGMESPLGKHSEFSAIPSVPPKYSCNQERGRILKTRYLCIGPFCSVASSGTIMPSQWKVLHVPRKEAEGSEQWMSTCTSYHLSAVFSITKSTHCFIAISYFSSIWNLHPIQGSSLWEPPRSWCSLVELSRGQPKWERGDSALLWLWSCSPLLPCSEVPSGDRCCHI